MRTAAVALIAGAVLIVALVGVVFYSSQLSVVHAQRGSCERSKLDRLANSAGWWAAERARMDTATDRRQEQHARSTARIAAEQYGAIAAQLEARGGINCARVFPAPLP
jgi:hypothetical protein